MKTLFLEKKSQSQTFIFFLIDHLIGNKGVETSVPKFSNILPEFGQIKTFGVRLHPQLIHHFWNQLFIQ